MSEKYLGAMLLNSIPALNQSNVFIKNPSQVEKKLLDLIQGGAKQLKIISDFDETVTKQRVSDGSHPLTSLGVLHGCPSLAESYKIVSKTLFEQYHPVEMDNTLDRAKKEKIMEQWWQEESNILKGFRLPRKEIEQGAMHSEFKIRDYALEMLKYCNNHHIPILIFSAGLGDGITAILKANKVLLSNITIISNFLQFKSGDLVNGYNTPLIHILNKNEKILRQFECSQDLKNRSNVLLLGDTVQDAEMIADNPTRIILRVGFVKDKHSSEFERFSKEFDIVLIDDQTMVVPFSIIKLISPPVSNTSGDE